MGSSLLARECIPLRSGWKFAKGNIEQAADPQLDDAAWESVSIPHDWAISGPYIRDGEGATAKLPWKGEGWYRRVLPLKDRHRGKRVYLLFDGVMAFPTVYVNGDSVGGWDYGYNSFFVDITDQLDFEGENVLAVHADTRQHRSRWYPGAGIYRKVQMMVVDPVHVPVWGSYVTTPIVKPHYADVRIQLRVKNAGKADSARIVHQVVAPNGKVVASESFRTFLPSQKETLTEATLTLRNPQRWDINNPVRYKVHSQVFVGGRKVDVYQTSFGVRTFRFDPDHGFFLNDRRVQLKGVNLHHGHGPLGAAFYPRALERQLQMMQAMGANAVRNSHNVAAPEFLEMCDSMGLLVINELFDKFDDTAGFLDGQDFEEFAHRNVRNFMLRDRNHPSVILWSVGNEIPDVQENQDMGFHRLHTVLNYVNKYDPTRPTTLVNDKWQAASLRHFDLYDVHAYNYDRRYRLARQLEPNKSVIISESASTLSTRGHYTFPLPTQKTDFPPDLQLSSYDLYAPYWAEIADDDFMWQQEESYIAGEFVWTGFDYLGEPTPYENAGVKAMGLAETAASRSSYFGIVDLVGIPKDRYYLYKSHWQQEETTLHILPHWNWPDRIGKTVPVFVYTSADCAELFLNGRSLGTRCKSPKSEVSTERFRLMWPETLYEAGTLEVVAYREGKEVARQQLETTGKVNTLRLSPDRAYITADGQDLSYVLIEALDDAGRLVPNADNELKIRVEGVGELVGVGNGNPQSFHDFQGNTIPLFHGKAMAIIRAGDTSGEIRVRISSPKLGTQEVKIKTE